MPARLCPINNTYSLNRLDISICRKHLRSVTSGFYDGCSSVGAVCVETVRTDGPMFVRDNDSATVGGVRLRSEEQRFQFQRSEQKLSSGFGE